MKNLRKNSNRAVLSGFFLMTAASALAAGGACPSGVPVTGNSCFFIAANGSDTNTGTDEQHPWLHAPGMGSCASACLTQQNAMGQARTDIGAIGIIFRGGDTWHFGNSSASPYTGGTWAWQWDGDANTCTFATQTGCNYLGVDTTWYNSSVCGSSWCRPILNADNPLSISTVSSCAYQIAANGTGQSNTMVWLNDGENAEVYFDNFEMLGLCGETSVGNIGFDNDYIRITNNDVTNPNRLFVHNVYIHGWTATSLINSNWTLCDALGGDASTLLDISHLVIDGSDSVASNCTWGSYPSWYHFNDSYISHIAQGVGQNCHDIHDVILDNIVAPAAGGHQNILECNANYTGGWDGEPSSSANVFYNLIVRHSNVNVDLWFCPTSLPDYDFNNIMYDTSGEGWSLAGTLQYSACTWTGGVYFFNNTLNAGGADVGGNNGTWQAPCGIAGSVSSSQVGYLHAYNNNLLDTTWSTSSPECVGGPNSSTNVSLTEAQGISQGYLTSSGVQNKTDACANDATPCAPTAATNGTVGAGTNYQSYCAALASYGGETQIGTAAANACRYGTTDGCAYNKVTHTMACPAQTAVARPASAAWDAGAYEFSSGGGSGISPPTALTGVVQ